MLDVSFDIRFGYVESGHGLKSWPVDVTVNRESMWVVWAQEPVDQSETAATIGSWHSWHTGDMPAVKVVVLFGATVGGKHVDSMDIEAGIVVALHTALTEKPWAAKTLVTGI